MLHFILNRKVSVEHFRDLLIRSGLAARRPADDLACLQGMIDNSNLVATCWEEERLVGIARSVTDFHYCCYLSDLAVDATFQRQGIGARLIQMTQEALGAKCLIILLSAPAAVDYYPHLGFERHPQAWILPRDKKLGRL